jgi:hypothetical protein
VSLVADEVSFALWGSLSRSWAPRGQPPVVKTTGRRKGMKLFGAIEFFRGGVGLTRSGGLYAERNGLEAAQGRGMPRGGEGVQALRALEGQRFETEGAFLQAVEKQLGAEALGQYRALLLKRSRRGGPVQCGHL